LAVAHPLASSRHLAFGVPDAEHLSEHLGYVASLNYKTRTPNFVVEHLTRERLAIEDGDRKFSTFHPNQTVFPLFRAGNEDYLRSGFSRGHMAPAGNHKFSQPEMDDTFMLNDNTVPQDFDNNAYYWRRVEIFARELTGAFDEVFIWTGPLWMNGPDGYTRFRQIGRNHVWAPTHLFKVIAARDVAADGQARDENVFVGAFIIPNEHVEPGTPLTKFQVDPSVVDHHVGAILAPGLDMAKTNDLCKSIRASCSLVDNNVIANWYLSSDLERAKNAADLERTWKNATKKGVRPSEESTTVYRRKKEALSVLTESSDAEQPRIE
jgi:DNA/RNA endonuclease G (NUC1)